MQTLALLMLAAAAGWLAAMAGAEAAARWRRGADLPSFIRSLPPLDPADSERFLVLLSERLTARFRHGVGRYPFESNPLFWVGGWFTPKLRLIEDTEILFRYSRRACCSQFAQAFVDIVTARGGQARIAALQGHVLAEAHCRGEWRVFDPDYGVILQSEGRLLTLEELIRCPALTAAAYRGNRVSADPQILLSVLRRGHFVRLPAGAHLSPRTAVWQRRLHTWRWAPPAVAAAAAGTLLLMTW